jgi:DNA-binding NarL/FixJ family response regulator
MTARSEGSARESRPRVLIVDDYPGLVIAWRRWLQSSYDIVGGVSESRDVLKTTAELKPDVIVLDVWMPGSNGLDLCRDIRRTAPDTKVILVSAADEEHVRATAIRLGASGFILKSSEPRELDRAIQHALRGETYFPPLVRRYRSRIDPESDLQGV